MSRDLRGPQDSRLLSSSVFPAVKLSDGPNVENGVAVLAPWVIVRRKRTYRARARVRARTHTHTHTYIMPPPLPLLLPAMLLSAL